MANNRFSQNERLKNSTAETNPVESNSSSSKEIGRSGFLVDAGHKKILMDYGVLLKRNRETAFPLNVKPKEIDAVILTHAHLDHSGLVPPLFLTDVIGLQALGTARPLICLTY